MLDTASIETQASIERFEKKQERAAERFGWGDTVGALAIAEKVLPALTDAFTAALEADDELTRVLRRLEPEVIALSCLSTCFHSIALEAPAVGTWSTLGANINHELWARGLIEHDKRLAASVERIVRRKHGDLKYRRQAARSIAKRGVEFKDKSGSKVRVRYDNRAPWSKVDCVTAGAWLLDVVVSTLPEIFLLETRDDQSLQLTITDGALAVANAACAWAIRKSPVFLPAVVPPVPWTGWNKGGPVDPRMQRSATVLRSNHRQTAGVVNAAIASGQMQPALDALNAAQATAWTINKRVLDVIRECHTRQIVAPGLPRMKDYLKPDLPKPWEEMTDLERTFWKIRAAKVKQANRGLKSDRISFAEDFATAEELAEHERFYTPCNMDWRGRVYALPHFNFQREDRVRGLFLFADGETIGEEGLWWLKVHVANCGDFDKISKASFEERVKWTNATSQMVQFAADAPMLATDFWMKADKPFLFLAACMELTAAIATGPEYVTRLPVSWDGSCSGLQHLAAMTRAKEGEYVNLIPTPKPEDVYQRVADAAAIVVAAEAAEGHELAQVCLDEGITRSLVKRNVMTYSYSSKKFGMAKQLESDLMEPLVLKVMAGEIDEHPYGADEGKAAAKYLAHRIYDAIEQIVEKPAKAMGFLQKLARALAHEGKPLSWVTPVGIPWVNRYHEYDLARVKLWLHDNGVKLRHRAVVAVGHQREIDKTRAANGVAPNFVHACDAAHLLLVVNAAYREGFRHFALVHDSFGCLAPQSKRFHQIIREQFVEMYEQHDVLAEVLAQAKSDLTAHNHGRLPEPVERGSLNIKDILNARYAFA